ncbi:DUF192 domain-containing protein [Erysipelothrix tonsillarum]|uniref:DUF192 domain-containing protein n=1 Tax=Erysipelothrix tonsillarum TaxID=38402 RepID=UPI000368CD25|nr:DUF192 domain-containing protein [Erysipelothrix tonsillarum]
MIKNLEIASNFGTRFKGLMLRKEINEDQGMLFLHCARVHTCFMKFDICVIYLDKDFNIIDHEIIKPWRLGSKVKGARHLIEASPAIVRSLSDITFNELIMKEG